VDYDNARFMVGLFYGRLGLPDAEKSLALAERFLAKVTMGIADLRLSLRGLVYVGPLKVETLRKSRLVSGSLPGVASHAINAREVGIYVHDTGFSRTVAPLVFCNFHLSASGSIGTIPLAYGQPGAAVRSFVLAGLERSTLVRFPVFLGLIHELFREMQGTRGAVWKSVPYVFDGATSLEWAYRNISAAIPGGRVSEWSPGGDLPLTDESPDKPGFKADDLGNHG
jgi:hypothetical protein